MPGIEIVTSWLVVGHADQSANGVFIIIIRIIIIFINSYKIVKYAVYRLKTTFNAVDILLPVFTVLSHCTCGRQAWFLTVFLHYLHFYQYN